MCDQVFCEGLALGSPVVDVNALKDLARMLTDIQATRTADVSSSSRSNEEACDGIGPQTNDCATASGARAAACHTDGGGSGGEMVRNLADLMLEALQPTVGKAGEVGDGPRAVQCSRVE
jgi:hypothetical protein